MSATMHVRNMHTNVVRLVGDTPSELWRYAVRQYPTHAMSDPKYDERGNCWLCKLTPLEGNACKTN